MKKESIIEKAREIAKNVRSKSRLSVSSSGSISIKVSDTLSSGRTKAAMRTIRQQTQANN